MIDDDAKGLAGDRRRNPFPSLNDTEYALLIATMERAAEMGAQKAVDRYMRGACEQHMERTTKLETVVFGSSETGVVGLDQQIHENAAAISSLKKFGWLLLGAAISALALGLVEIVVALITHAR